MAFGTILLASIVVVFTALIVIASSGSGNNNDNRRNSRGDGGGVSFIPMRMFGPDLFWYWDPYYQYRQPVRTKDPDEMGFFQAVFSVVFGDGDPNLTVEDLRWQLLGNYIRSKGGVVTAEQLAPFLDTPPEFLQNRKEAFRDESFVVPALLRFGGSPQVDENGNILYVFPTLAVEWEQKRGWFGRGKKETASLVPVPGTEVADNPPGMAPSDSIVVEQEWQQTRASLMQKIGVGFLLGLNAFGIALLSFQARDPQVIRILSLNGFAWLTNLLPLFQGYAISLFALPLYRWFRNQQRNSQIRQRNKTRYDSYWLVNRPDKDLEKKIISAEKESRQQKQSAGEVVYTTEKDFLEQPDPIL